jgi:ribosomal protein L31
MPNKTVKVRINVTPSASTTITGASMTTISVSVDPDPVELDDTVSLAEGIDWEIEDNCHPYWTFTADNSGNSTGITVKNHRGRFRDPGGNSSKKHSWIRQKKDNAKTPYHYTVSVTNEISEVDPDKRISITWDPLIQNN